MTCPYRARLAAACLLFLTGIAAAAERPAYPLTKTRPVTETIHGVEITDPYRLLEEGDSWAVRLWDKRQNTLTRTMLDRLPERARILERLNTLEKIPWNSTPIPAGTRYFFWRHEGLQEHPVLYVREGSYKAEPKLVLDPNTWTDDGSQECELASISPDGRYVAYARRDRGSSRNTLYVRDVETGRDLPDTIPLVYTYDLVWISGMLAWQRDSRAFYYSRYCKPAPEEAEDKFAFMKVFYHVLGSDWKDDPIVSAPDSPREYFHGAATATDYRHLFLHFVHDPRKHDVYMMDLDAPEPEIKPLIVGLDAQFAYNIIGGTLYVLTDWKAPCRCVYTCNLSDPRPENWKVLVPEQKGIIAQGRMTKNHLPLHLFENARSALRIFSIDGALLNEISLPTIGTVGLLEGKRDGHKLFFSFTSFTYPLTTFCYDMARDELEQIDQMDLGVDFSQYETRQVWYTSKDGTRVPMFIVHRKGLKLDGSNPVLLTGYGGFGKCVASGFSSTVAIWLETGGVCALPNLRGGGAFGHEWHRAGQCENKQNTFDDFIAAAEYLIAEGYTSPERLAIEGASNGGLLVGAALTQRPDLFRAVLCEAPVLDMIRHHKLREKQHSVDEYGSAEDPEQFKYLYAYSPYHHVQEGVAYPAVFLKTAADDTVANPAHARKMTARLQAATSSDRPILLYVAPEGGHGGANLPLNKRLEAEADDYTWLMWQLGMIPDPDE